MALSDQQFNQFLLDAEDSTGFGINRYNELKDAGATNQQIAQIAANAPVIGPKAREALPELSDIFYTRIRGELETQYNNIVEAGKIQGKNLSYRGRSSDLPTIFNQQARQLADAGVSSVANLRLSEITEPRMSLFPGFRFGDSESDNVLEKKEPRQVGTRTYQGLIDVTTGQPVKAANLGGAVTIDRDTGAQKWGDIFTGVKGGANYGIQFAPDGSPILFPVWEKTKSPIAQLGLGEFESVIGPILTIAGAYYGMPGLGEVGGAAAGAAAGNSVGQYLASGDIDWGQVALSAAVAGGTQALLSGAEVAGAPTPDGGMVGTPGVSIVYPVAPPNIGVAPLAPQAAAGATGISLLDGVNFGRTGETGLLSGGSGEAFVAAPGAAPGLSAMGGGTGLTIPVAGGTVAQGPFIPATQAPLLGGGSEFGVTDALRLANQARGLFGQQPQMGGLLGGQRGGGQPMGVDYSGLLALLQARTGTPNVASLLAPAVNRFQPLTTQQSLLG